MRKGRQEGGGREVTPQTQYRSTASRKPSQKNQAHRQSNHSTPHSTPAPVCSKHTYFRIYSRILPLLLTRMQSVSCVWGGPRSFTGDNALSPPHRHKDSRRVAPLYLAQLWCDPHSLALEPMFAIPMRLSGDPQLCQLPPQPEPCTDLLGQCQALRVGNRRQLLFLQPLDSVLVISQVKLGAHQDDGSARAVVPHLREPLGRWAGPEGVQGSGEQGGSKCNKT